MIARVPVKGYFEVNCYVWVDDESKHGFLIDPGAQGHELMQLCREQGWIIEKILLTHGHFDHIGGIAAIREEADIPVYIHEAGKVYLADTHLNLSRYCHCDMTVHNAKYFRDGDIFCLDSNPSSFLRVIHTPGHTPDSVVFYDEEHSTAFVGDTIFKGSRGNDQYPGGNGRLLLQSIRQRILILPNETRLFSGHSDETTVGAEKIHYF
ncbi:MAG: MBL fold metallo-hydrolase [Clostridia bacterium]|nr:MBL fold metallo-hydrolase [Clostridia bacterium]